jgi:hypothetical protein
VTGVDRAGLLDLDTWNERLPKINWKGMPTQRDDPRTAAALRLNTHTGRPPARDSLLS